MKAFATHTQYDIVSIEIIVADGFFTFHRRNIFVEGAQVNSVYLLPVHLGKIITVNKSARADACLSEYCIISFVVTLSQLGW